MTSIDGKTLTLPCKLFLIEQYLLGRSKVIRPYDLLLNDWLTIDVDGDIIMMIVTNVDLDPQKYARAIQNDVTEYFSHKAGVTAIDQVNKYCTEVTAIDNLFSQCFNRETLERISVKMEKMNQFNEETKNRIKRMTSKETLTYIQELKGNMNVIFA